MSSGGPRAGPVSAPPAAPCAITVPPAPQEVGRSYAAATAPPGPALGSRPWVCPTVLSCLVSGLLYTQNY